jgi:hypothetical protein
VSPPAALSLPGTVVSAGGAPEGVVITDAGTVAVNVRTPDRPGGGLLIFPISTPTAASATAAVDLGGSARHLTLAGPIGQALIAEESDHQFLRVDQLLGLPQPPQPRARSGTPPSSVRGSAVSFAVLVLGVE